MRLNFNGPMRSVCNITVLMSVYNGEPFLRDAIDSILAQTYQDFEFVIYDDCSTDHTADIIQSYSDSRIVYRRNTVNKGLTANLADGVARSEARYIVRMDSDDIACPDRLKRQSDWMDQHPEISIMGTSVTYFHDVPGDRGVASQPQEDAIIKAKLFISFTLMHPSIIIRREDLSRNLINYNPEYRYSQDHALYFDCIMAGLKFANMPESLLYMRAHKGSISRYRHTAQQECSMRARLNFLQVTGIAEECDEGEIGVYNALASEIYPDTIDKVHQYERFVEKVCSNKNITLYFDTAILLKLMSNALCDKAYFAVDDKRTLNTALAARKSTLMKYSTHWSLKQKIKFIVKCIRAKFAYK